MLQGWLGAPLLPQPPVLKRAQLHLALDRSSYAAADTVRLAAVVDVEEGWHIQSHSPTLPYLIPTTLTVHPPPGFAAPQVEYPPHRMWQASFETEELAVYEGRTVIVASFPVPAGAHGEYPIRAELYYQSCDDRVCLPPVTATAEIVLGVDRRGEAIHQETFALFDARSGVDAEVSLPARPVSLRRMLVILTLGLLGGLILNAMPCVLPVLSLKLFALVQKAGQGRRDVVLGALATALGILLSFWMLALAAILARSGGRLVGWGIQFQSPLFVAFLALVLVLFSLNLWGLFDVPLPRRLAALLERRRSGGLLGHLGAGLFATLMATPCSAPYLGTAVGFALSQSAGATLATFTAIGAGMALPYLLLAVAPASAKLLPRPGPWMDHLKGVMGFLLSGAAIWLLYVLGAQISAERLAVLEAGLLSVGLFAWLHQRFAERRIFALGMALAAIATLLLASTSGGSARITRYTERRLDWQPFDREQAERLSAEQGRLVFVDVTADWCATCKVNERLVLETAAVADLFERHDVLAMKADWTNRNDDIARYLADFGRYAIPFYVLYRPGREPHVFGELLTRAHVTQAIEESATAMAAQRLAAQRLATPRPAAQPSAAPGPAVLRTDSDETELPERAHAP